jgi:hypothetical protein
LCSRLCFSRIAPTWVMYSAGGSAIDRSVSL